ncbi:hypothetical protein Goshw_021404 [Gossypium schwendimanii]|uniref:Uncharacterized protein n=1 Tax=Gossypium schwendimanii TaxID=34291 RepID=A0A7J9LHF0_GOSSC|nr:hypothetical protein [Gossypium schwendimanii]
MASKASSSISQALKRYIKKPWEVAGPCADPEYKNALPKATEYRIRCPATSLQKPIVPTSDPETIFDIKYYARDQRRNRPPIRRTVLKKADVEKMMKENTFDVNDFPKVYLTAKFEEDENAMLIWLTSPSSELNSPSIAQTIPAPSTPHRSTPEQL